MGEAGLGLFSDFSETANSTSDGDGGGRGMSPGAACDRLPASLAVPNTHTLKRKRTGFLKIEREINLSRYQDEK